MASVDLKDAYYSVPIDKEYQKYLKFLWEYPLKFIVMPNGYGPAMRAFTKLMKPPFSFLRSEGYLSVIYVDDYYLQGDSFTKCAENVIRTIDILESLGFYIKMEKSEIIPKQQITFLGVIIDSLHMTITLTNEKKQKNLKLCTAEWQIRVSAAHIPGSENVVADKNSRIFEQSSEWKLRDSVFKHIVSIFGEPDIDLFPSRINNPERNNPE